MELDNKENNILWNCLIALKNEIQTLEQLNDEIQALEQLNEKLCDELNKANKVLADDIDFIKNKSYIHALNRAIIVFITEIDNYVNWRPKDE